MKYKIYFEIYGKKMQTVIEAKNENEAKEKIKDKIIFAGIEKVIDEDKTIDFLKGIFGFKE